MTIFLYLYDIILEINKNFIFLNENCLKFQVFQTPGFVVTLYIKKKLNFATHAK